MFLPVHAFQGEEQLAEIGIEAGAFLQERENGLLAGIGMAQYKGAFARSRVEVSAQLPGEMEAVLLQLQTGAELAVVHQKQWRSCTESEEAVAYLQACIAEVEVVWQHAQYIFQSAAGCCTAAVCCNSAGLFPETEIILPSRIVVEM